MSFTNDDFGELDYGAETVGLGHQSPSHPRGNVGETGGLGMEIEDDNMQEDDTSDSLDQFEGLDDP